jgi:phage gp36-like protein
MPYATQADMLARFATRELIQRTNLGSANPTSLDAAVLDTALGDASAEIDLYLTGYALPAVVPEVLKRLCCDIARANLYHDALPVGEDRPEWLRRYETAVRMLEAIRDGKIELGIGGDPLKVPAVHAAGNARVLSRKSLSTM